MICVHVNVYSKADADKIQTDRQTDRHFVGLANHVKDV